MKKFILAIIFFMTLTPMSSLAALDPAIFDYGYFGVTTANKKSKILWAEYPYNRHQWESVQIESDGQYIVRLFDKKGSLIIQNIQDNSQTLDLTEYKAHGIQIQLSRKTGSYARLVQATSTNPLSQTVNFFEEPF